MKIDPMQKVLAYVSLVAAIVAFTPQSGHTTGPCDIYKGGGTPCVAAYSTVRALYDSYNGALYQVRRTDGSTKDIVPLLAGGYVDASIQDNFCQGSDCRISIIYDQSGKGNHLTKAGHGSPVYGLYNDSEAVANALPIKIAGHKAYGVHITAGGWTTPGQVGYRNNNTQGVAKGDDPESIYIVTDGTFVNGACCFDFGNAETQLDPLVYTSMDALYFGTNNWWDVGAGSGPWIMADLENGVFNHGGATGEGRVHLNSNESSLAYPFVTALLKNNSAGAVSGGPFTIKGGNAQSGVLTTMWNGARPDGYGSLGKAGGVVLGVGGDNSSGAQGNFYEGIMTAGFASDATDDAIQANIVAAGFGSNTLIETVPAHRDSVFNGSFGQGALGWSFNTWGGTAQGSVVNGEYKIDISALGTANASIQLVQNGIIMQQGKSYEVKFDAYASANRTLEANVELDVSPWTSYLPALKSFDLTTSKSTYSYTFTMTNATDSNGRISFNAGASTTGLFLDNVSIKEVPTPVSLISISGRTVSDMVLRLHNTHLNIDFSATQGAAITINVIDLKGNTYGSASFRTTDGASQSRSFDLSGMPRGVYLVEMTVGQNVVTRSMINYLN